MPEQNGWVWQPILRGMCSFLEVKNGLVTLMDIFHMNNAMAVGDENVQRMKDAG